ncbi:MAG: copper resistance protein CopC [Pseudomonadota bacterium]|nr:copper resistance protein CopC [Pseudomonadota bacterium]
MKTIPLFVAALLLSLAIIPGAEAHAFLVHATPAVGSSSREWPARARLWFTDELEAAFSTVRVLDRDGKQVDKQDKQLDAADHKLLQVSLPPLAPGRYRVVWRALSVDTHVTEGDFTFEVLP